MAPGITLYPRTPPRAGFFVSGRSHGSFTEGPAPGRCYLLSVPPAPQEPEGTGPAGLRERSHDPLPPAETHAPDHGLLVRRFRAAVRARLLGQGRRRAR